MAPLTGARASADRTASQHSRPALRAVLVGAGAVAREQLACLAALDGAEVVGVCDLSPAVAEVGRVAVPRAAPLHRSLPHARAARPRLRPRDNAARRALPGRARRTRGGGPRELSRTAGYGLGPWPAAHPQRRA